MTAEAAYPGDPAARARWIRARRGARNPSSEEHAHAALIEKEPDARGRVVGVATIFLTNRECPWTCAMCDLWRNTTLRSVAPGAIPRQIGRALAELAPASVLKLYNSGSFFDAGAIPRQEWPEIARLCRGFNRVIVECHPRLIGPRVLEFAAMLDGTLEVAMGLETCHEAALAKLNKRFSVADYQAAAAFLRRAEIGIRTFLMVRPPFVPDGERLAWMQRSVRLAFDAGSEVVSLIPTRLGNGALEALGAREPSLGELEDALDFALSLRAGRAFADTWDFERFAQCSRCANARRERLARMNLAQKAEARVNCPQCEDR